MYKVKLMFVNARLKISGMIETPEGDRLFTPNTEIVFHCPEALFGVGSEVQIHLDPRDPRHVSRIETVSTEHRYDTH